MKNGEASWKAEISWSTLHPIFTTYSQTCESPYFPRSNQQSHDSPHKPEMEIGHMRYPVNYWQKGLYVLDGGCKYGAQHVEV
jgi:hypothetical protein